MLKKKISILTLTIMMISNICFAANWTWLESSDKVSIYFDSNTCRINSGTLHFWSKTRDVNGKFLISYHEYRNGIIHTSDRTFYDINGRVLERREAVTTKRIIPGSNGERFINIITSYCKPK